MALTKYYVCLSNQVYNAINQYEHGQTYITTSKNGDKVSLYDDRISYDRKWRICHLYINDEDKDNLFVKTGNSLTLLTVKVANPDAIDGLTSICLSLTLDYDSILKTYENSIESNNPEEEKLYKGIYYLSIPSARAIKVLNWDPIAKHFTIKLKNKNTGIFGIFHAYKIHETIGQEYYKIFLGSFADEYLYDKYNAIFDYDRNICAKRNDCEITEYLYVGEKIENYDIKLEEKPTMLTRYIIMNASEIMDFVMKQRPNDSCSPKMIACKKDGEDHHYSACMSYSAFNNNDRRQYSIYSITIPEPDYKDLVSYGWIELHDLYFTNYEKFKVYETFEEAKETLKEMTKEKIETTTYYFFLNNSLVCRYIGGGWPCVTLTYGLYRKSYTVRTISEENNGRLLSINLPNYYDENKITIKPAWGNGPDLIVDIFKDMPSAIYYNFIKEKENKMITGDCCGFGGGLNAYCWNVKNGKGIKHYHETEIGIIQNAAFKGIVPPGLKKIFCSIDRIKDIKFNGPATILFDSCGRKFVTKCGSNDQYDPYKGLIMVLCKSIVSKKLYKEICTLNDPADEIKMAKHFVKNCYGGDNLIKLAKKFLPKEKTVKDIVDELPKKEKEKVYSEIAKAAEAQETILSNMVKDEWSLGSMAKALGTTSNAVEEMCNNLGLDISYTANKTSKLKTKKDARKKVDDKMFEKMKALYDQGVKVKDIAKKFGINASCIYQNFRKVGVETNRHKKAEHTKEDYVKSINYPCPSYLREEDFKEIIDISWDKYEARCKFPSEFKKLLIKECRKFKCIQLYKDGYSMYEISDIIGIPSGAVQAYINGVVSDVEEEE